MISFIYFCSQVYNQKKNIGILKQKQLVYSKKRDIHRNIPIRNETLDIVY